MFIFENIGRNINNVSIQCFTNVIWRRDDGNSLSWSLVARSRVADRHTPREKTLWNHFNKHMEKHNNYFLLMFLKKHWEKMVHVFTMFFSWDWRSQDGFPTVLRTSRQRNRHIIARLAQGMNSSRDAHFLETPKDHAREYARGLP